MLFRKYRVLDAVEGTRHEWVVAHGVCKDHQLGTGVVDRALGNLEGATLDQVAEEAMLPTS